MKPKISLRLALLLFTICSLTISMVARRIYKQYQSEQIELDMEETRKNLQNGKIHAGLSVSSYLEFANPRTKQDYGPFTEFTHGSGGFSSIWVLAKDGRLVRASFSSCLGRSVYFDILTAADILVLRASAPTDE